jgi:broad specificity phosphatase PhoE
MSTIRLELHSTTFDNEAGLASGHFDVALSPRGEIQALRMGEHYREREIGTVYASDLQRAVRTAEIAFAERRIPIFQDSRLRECDYGARTRHPAEEVHRAAAAHASTPYPGGESYEQVVQRVASFLDELSGRGESGLVVLVTHRAVLFSLQHLLEGVALADALQAPFAYQPGWTFELASPKRA